MKSKFEKAKAKVGKAHTENDHCVLLMDGRIVYDQIITTLLSNFREISSGLPYEACYSSPEKLAQAQHLIGPPQEDTGGLGGSVG